MLIPLHYIVQKYNIQFKGVLHVGAHICEELQDYECYLPRNKVLWIEALPDKVELNIATYPNLLIEQAVVSDKVETVIFNRSNNDQSSSILELGLHAVFHPHIVYVDSYKVETKTLNTILPKYDIDYNFLNLDIQGCELKALKGMEEYLHKVDYIFTEVNSDYVYKDCGLIIEIDDYLKRFGLERVETEWCNDYQWGDAFYIKKQKNII